MSNGNGDKDYTSKIYTAVSEAYKSSGFNKTEDEFRNELKNNPEYASKIYTAVSEAYGSTGFNKTEDEFKKQLGLSFQQPSPMQGQPAGGDVSTSSLPLSGSSTNISTPTPTGEPYQAPEPYISETGMQMPELGAVHGAIAQQRQQDQAIEQSMAGQPMTPEQLQQATTEMNAPQEAPNFSQLKIVTDKERAKELHQQRIDKYNGQAQVKAAAPQIESTPYRDLENNWSKKNEEMLGNFNEMKSLSQTLKESWELNQQTGQLSQEEWEKYSLPGLQRLNSLYNKVQKDQKSLDEIRKYVDDPTFAMTPDEKVAYHKEQLYRDNERPLMGSLMELMYGKVGKGDYTIPEPMKKTAQNEVKGALKDWLSNLSEAEVDDLKSKSQQEILTKYYYDEFWPQFSETLKGYDPTFLEKGYNAWTGWAKEQYGGQEGFGERGRADKDEILSKMRQFYVLEAIVNQNRNPKELFVETPRKNVGALTDSGKLEYSFLSPIASFMKGIYGIESGIGFGSPKMTPMTETFGMANPQEQAQRTQEVMSQAGLQGDPNAIAPTTTLDRVNNMVNLVAEITPSMVLSEAVIGSTPGLAQLGTKFDALAANSTNKMTRFLVNSAKYGTEAALKGAQFELAQDVGGSQAGGFIAGTAGSVAEQTVVALLPKLAEKHWAVRLAAEFFKRGFAGMAGETAEEVGQLYEQGQSFSEAYKQMSDEDKYFFLISTFAMGQLGYGGEGFLNADYSKGLTNTDRKGMTSMDFVSEKLAEIPEEYQNKFYEDTGLGEIKQTIESVKPEDTKTAYDKVVEGSKKVQEKPVQEEIVKPEIAEQATIETQVKPEIIKTNEQNKKPITVSKTETKTPTQKVEAKQELLPKTEKVAGTTEAKSRGNSDVVESFVKEKELSSKVSEEKRTRYKNDIQEGLNIISQHFEKTFTKQAIDQGDLPSLMEGVRKVADGLIRMGYVNMKDIHQGVVDLLKKSNVDQKLIDYVQNNREHLASVIANKKGVRMNAEQAATLARKGSSTVNKIVTKQIGDWRRGVRDHKKTVSQVKKEFNNYISENRDMLKHVMPSKLSKLTKMASSINENNIESVLDEVTNMLQGSKKQAKISELKTKIKKYQKGGVHPRIAQAISNIESKYDFSSMREPTFNEAMRGKAIMDNVQENLDPNNLTKAQTDKLGNLFQAITGKEMKPKDLSNAIQRNQDALNGKIKINKKAIERLGKNPISSLDVEDINDMIANLDKEREFSKKYKDVVKNRLSSKIDKANKDLDAQITKQGLRKITTEGKTESEISGERDTKRKGILRFVKEGNLNILSFSAMKDRGKKGFFNDHVLAPMQSGRKIMLQKTFEYTDIVSKVTSKYANELKTGTSVWTKPRRFYESRFGENQVEIFDAVNTSGGSKRKQPLTLMQQTALYMHMRNPQNRAAMLRGVAVKGDLTGTFTLTPESLQRIKTNIESNQAAMDTIKAMDKAYNKMAIDLKQKYLELTGNDLPIVDDYIRLIVNPYSINRADLDNAYNMLHGIGDKEVMDKMLDQGFLKERVGHGGGLVLEDALESFNSSAQQSAKFVGMAEPTIQVNNVLKTTGGKIEEFYGSNAKSYINTWLEDVTGFNYNKNELTKWWSALHSASISSIFAYNPGVVLKQFGSIFTAGAELGFDNILQGSVESFSGQGLSQSDIEAISPDARMRFAGNLSIEFGEPTARNFLSGRYFGENAEGKLNQASQFSQKGIAWMDKMTIKALFNAAHAKAKSEMPNASKDEVMKRTAELGEEMMNQTQPTYDPIYRSENARSSNSAIKMISLFSTAPNKAFNYVMELGAIAKYGTDSDKVKFAKAVLGLALGAIYIEGINELKKKLRQDKKDKDEFDTANFAINSLTNMFAGLGIVTEAAKAAKSQVTGEKYYSPSITGTIDLAKDFKKLSEGNPDAIIDVMAFHQPFAQFKGLNNLVKQVTGYSVGDMIESMYDKKPKPSNFNQRSKGSSRKQQRGRSTQTSTRSSSRRSSE